MSDIEFVHADCTEIEKHKVTLNLDGDTALFVFNTVVKISEHVASEDLWAMGAHEHTLPKIEAMMQQLERNIRSFMGEENKS